MGNAVKVKCKVVKTTAKAWMIEAKRVRGDIAQVWIPVSQIQKTETKARLSNEPHHRITEKNFDRSIWIPEWLLDKSELQASV